jgi:hypothetical protein
LAKLAEVLFIEVLHLYMNEQGEGRTGWLAGVRDRIVGQALNAMHSRPAHAYLTQWRMLLAANLLCRSTAARAHAMRSIFSMRGSVDMYWSASRSYA